MKKALFGLFLISSIVSTTQSASALSPAHPSCVSYLQTLKEASNSGINPSRMRQYLDVYKQSCSDGDEYTEVRSSSALSPSNPSCISYLQKIKEANNSGVNYSIIRQHLDTYKQNCSDGGEHREVNNTLKSKPIVEKIVNGVSTFTNEY